MAISQGFSTAHSYDITNKITKIIVRKIEFLENEINNLPLDNSLQKNEAEEHLRKMIDHCSSMLSDVRAVYFD